ncbi:MAG: fimbria/pilus outer membrane usher protein [Pseudomonadota bacterium]
MRLYVHTWLVLGLIGALLFGLRAFGEDAPPGAQTRFVEVRAAGRLLADKAALVDDPEYGLVLRLQDLDEKLPPDLPKLMPAQIYGDLFLPILPILVKHVLLDHEPGVLEFVGVSYPERPARMAISDHGRDLQTRLPPRPLPVASAPALALGDGGLAADLIGLDAPIALAQFTNASNATRGDEVQVNQPSADGWTLEPLDVDLGDKVELIPIASPGAAVAGVFAGGVGEGAPGDIRRRDPFDLPLLQSDEWRESLTSVILNGETVTEGALTIQGPDDQWAIRVVDLREWRVILDESRIMTFNGEPFYEVNNLDGAVSSFDDRTLTLKITLPASGFESSEFETARRSTLPPQSGRGAFLDYDALFLTGDGVRERLDALLEVGAFNEHGVLVSDFRAGDLTEDAELIRLETSLTKDFPDHRVTLRVGDSVTSSGTLGRPVRFGGVQIASNFATDPNFVTFPLPTIGGLAEQNSVAEVFLNNTVRVSEEVPAGPFEIDNLPVVSGAGEVQLRVTDLLGREQFLTQSYYVSPRLLKEGLSDYSVELGFERERFNDAQFDYGRPLLIGNESYGFTESLTGDVRAEISDDRQAFGLGGAALLGSYGLVSAGVIGSRDDDAGEGYEAFADYEYRGRNFNLGLRTEYADEKFRPVGQDREPIKRTDQVAMGVGLGPAGRVGAILINTETRNDQDRRSVVTNYSVPLGPGSFLLSGLGVIKPDEDYALTASYSLPLSPVRSMTATANIRDEASGARLQYRRGRGGTDLGASYRLASEIGDTPRRFDGTLRYDAEQATAQVDAVVADGEVTARGNLSGSVGLIDGRPALSRRLGRAFGMVALPGHPDVTVYLENREVGRTDQDGYLFLPRLNPYQENRIRIKAEDLPLDTEIEAEELVAVPYNRSGVQVAFNVKTNRSALATLLDTEGAPLPAGMEMVTGDGRLEARVADQGLAYIKGEGEGLADLLSKPGLPPYRCPLPAMPTEPMASLGEIRCE